MTDLWGWFQIGWSPSVARSDLVPLTVLGHELVARRSQAGTLVVTDAHCPHLGAPLDLGCTVGDDLRCPLHGWEWGQDGTNTKIPYRDDTAASVALRVWPSREIAGLLFVWIGDADRPPNYEPLPPDSTFDVDLHRDGLLGGVPAGTTRLGPMTVHPQLAVEDRVDVDHFVGPHGTVPPTLDDLTLDGPYFTTHVTLGDTEGGNRSQPPSEILSAATGIGLSCLRIRIPPATVYVVLSITPRDDRFSDVFHTLWVDPHSEDSDPALLDRILGMMREQLEKDLAIWARMRHVALPNDPAAAQPALTAVRDWAEQFHSGGSGVV